MATPGTTGGVPVVLIIPFRPKEATTGRIACVRRGTTVWKSSIGEPTPTPIPAGNVQRIPCLLKAALPSTSARVLQVIATNRRERKQRDEIEYARSYVHIRKVTDSICRILRELGRTREDVRGLPMAIDVGAWPCL